MTQEESSLEVKHRANFFHYIFNKNIKSPVGYKSPTAMIFEKKQASVTIYNNSSKQEQSFYRNSEDSTQYITNNTQNLFESHTHINPTAKVTSTHFSIHSQENIYNTDYIINRFDQSEKLLFNSVALENLSQKLLFNSVVLQKFTKYNSQKPTEINSSKASSRVLLKVDSEDPTTIIYQKDKEIIQAQYIKELEERVIDRVEERIKVEHKKEFTNTVSQEERIMRQREERLSAEKIYTFVMKRWDKELKRKGHLYD